MAPSNILLITTDQQRFDTINALGNKHIFTPHLNWLADNGVAFTRCYSDSPICMPARATIMTGRHGYSLGLTSNSNNSLPMKDNPTLPALLTRHGYQTRAQGKMHFHPMRANYGFEHMELPMDYYRERNQDISSGIPKAHGVGENEIEPVISTVHETQSLTYWTVKRSVDFLETRDTTRPFFLWTSFAKPHPPFDPCFNYWSLYNNKEVPDPSFGEWSERLEDIPQGFMSPTYCLNNAYRLSKEQMKDVKRAYYACITQIDYSLGLLFARMREMDLLDNTLIIFTSDHGDNMGDHHMAGKSNFLEGCSHVPLIVKPPRSTAQKYTGAKCESVVTLADIMPTALGGADADIPSNLDGRDLFAVADGTAGERVFYGYCDNFICIMRGYDKYIWTQEGGGELLFNLADDPKEQRNLVNSPEQAHKDKIEGFRKELVHFCEKYAPEKIKDGEIIRTPAPSGPQDIGKWPGFHSLAVDTDVLH